VNANESQGEKGVADSGLRDEAEPLQRGCRIDLLVEHQDRRAITPMNLSPIRNLLAAGERLSCELLMIRRQRSVLPCGRT